MRLEDSPFDSGHYGLPIGRASSVAAGEVDALLAAARARGLAMVVVRAADEGDPLVAALAARGVAPVETLVTSALDPARPRPAPAADDGGVIVTAHDRVEGAAAEAIARLTGEAIGGTHLHKDGRLPRARTAALYAAWARNDVAGRAQRTFVARAAGAAGEAGAADAADAARPVRGYLAALARDGEAVIDLVAVDPRAQGAGVGARLLHAFLAWAAARGLAARVGTQADNPALRLYQRFGFVPCAWTPTFHLWLDELP